MKTLNPNTKTTRRAFPLGRVVATPGALAEIAAEDISAALSRHSECDWGECGTEDWQENDFALDNDLRLFSVYRDGNNVKFWIITEADRSSTTILLPEDY
ncbi:MAG: hypothetical protein V4671_16045 [Armatimonadota bacterium]